MNLAGWFFNWKLKLLVLKRVCPGHRDRRWNSQDSEWVSTEVSTVYVALDDTGGGAIDFVVPSDVYGIKIVRNNGIKICVEQGIEIRGQKNSIEAFLDN